MQRSEDGARNGSRNWGNSLSGLLNDPDAWARITPYLDQALDLEIAERATWLEELERTHAEVARTLRPLLAELEALNSKGYLESSPLQSTRLDAMMPALERMVRQRVEVESGDWLRSFPTPALSSATEDRGQGMVAGDMLGVYRLIREIGHGGMSTVWLAERVDGQLKREVALKMSFAGPLRAQMVERFQRERDILATLTHPNIARLYDAGISASGQSYLAMEHVHGFPLTHYCDAARLSVRERLQLFLQVLAAVEFAHTHLVLHRDLKPSNILVTSDARVVLLDFGIAKLLSRDVTADSPLTEMSVRALTPDYASPEHIAGKVLSTTSDVYSLGVVLYELLAGARPFCPQGVSRRDLEEAILTQDPPRPSQSAFNMDVAAARNTTPRKLALALTGDLDTILLKALKKAPAERYLSIGAFAQDLENYLGNLPVSARPDSGWYRIGRFTSRYKLQVTAATIALLAIIGGGAAAVWQAHAAAQQRDRATALASRDGAINEFMYTLFIEAAASTKAVTVAEILERSEKLALADTGESYENRAALLAAVARLYIGSGEDSRGTKLVDRALTLLSHSGDSPLRSMLNCDRALLMADRGQVEAGIPLIDGELAALDSDPETAYYCLSNRTYIAYKSGDTQGALQYARLALQRFHQTASQPLAGEGYLLGQVGYGLYLQGDTGQATRYFELAQRKFTESGRDKSLAANVVMGYWANMSMGTGVPKRALQLYERQLSAYAERDAGSGPPAAYIHNRALALETIGRYTEARSAFESAQRRATEANLRDTQGAALLGLASVAQQLGDLADAARYLKAADDLLGASLQGDTRVAMRSAIFHGQRALLDGKPDEARRLFDSVLDRHRKNAATISAALGKAEVELMAGNAAAAVANARIALDMAKSLQGTLQYSNLTGLSWLAMGRALEARGERAQAREAFLAAVNNLSNTVDEDHPELLRARRLLASSG
jgi:serine/threonine-protein kinase